MYWILNHYNIAKKSFKILANADVKMLSKKNILKAYLLTSKIV